MYNTIYRELSQLLPQIHDLRQQKENSSDSPVIRYRDTCITLRKMYSGGLVNSTENNMTDSAIEENQCFTYPVFMPLHTWRKSTAGKHTSSGQNRYKKTDSVICILHGLNERRWEKYLPWAYSLCKETNKTVVILPIAFHLNRAPKSWIDIRKMMPLVKRRRMYDGNEQTSSFANAALSQRIDDDPSRFIRGAYQTVHDVERFAALIRLGKDPLIASDASIHFFSYSIGCSLSEALLMGDDLRAPADKIFSDSKAFMFCGGSILEYANPVSKAILDDKAHTALDAFFDSFGSQCRKELDSTSGQSNSMKMIFSSLMKRVFFPGFRSERLIKLGERAKIELLSTDTVFPEWGVRKSLVSCSETENQTIPVSVIEGAPGSSHETPFPLATETKGRRIVQNIYESVFDEAAEFLV